MVRHSYLWHTSYCIWIQISICSCSHCRIIYTNAIYNYFGCVPFCDKLLFHYMPPVSSQLILVYRLIIPQRKWFWVIWTQKVVHILTCSGIRLFSQVMISNDITKTGIPTCSPTTIQHDEICLSVQPGGTKSSAGTMVATKSSRNRLDPSSFCHVADILLNIWQGLIKFMTLQLLNEQKFDGWSFGNFIEQRIYIITSSW